MTLQIHVDAYSGYKASERPRVFQLDDTLYEVAAIEDQWRTPEATFFKVRATDGKHFVLRYDEHADEWTLLSDFDGAKLFARPGIQIIPVAESAIREAESRIAGCEQCRGDEAHILFDWILADILDKRGTYEFVLTAAAHCPACKAPITEKTCIEPQGGIEISSLR